MPTARSLVLAAIGCVLLALPLQAQMSLKAARKKSLKDNKPIVCFVIYTGKNIPSLSPKLLTYALRQKTYQDQLKGYHVAKAVLPYGGHLIESEPVKQCGKQGLSFFVPGGVANIYNKDVGMDMQAGSVKAMFDEAVPAGTAKVKEWMDKQVQILEKHGLKNLTDAKLRTNYDALVELAKHCKKGFVSDLTYEYCDLAIKLTKANKDLDKAAQEKQTIEHLMFKAATAKVSFDYENQAKFFGEVAKRYPKNVNAGPAACNQADAYIKMGKHPQAKAVLNRVLATPQWSNAHGLARGFLKRVKD